MLDIPDYRVTDIAWVRRLIRETGWGTLVTSGPGGIAASHYPFILQDSEAERPVLLTHVGKPDEQILGILDGSGPGTADREVLVTIEGPNGYVSPSWYPAEQIIPTWNFVAAHLWGTPEVLDEEENFRVLTRLVDEFEAPVENPSSLLLDEEMTRRVATETVGLRIPMERWEAKNKLSQDKAPEVVRDVIAHLEAPGPYANAALAAEMRRNSGL